MNRKLITQETMEENLSSDLDGRRFLKEIIKYIKKIQLIGLTRNLKLIIKIKMESQCPKTLVTQITGGGLLPEISVGQQLKASK